jgi:aspartyl-tRNA(Asn)/glutamyl-tRNA(Gln) amidotransferase subunit B
MAMSPDWVERVREALPELPARRRERYQALGLDRGTAGILSNLDALLRATYDEALQAGASPRAAANWLTGEVVGWMRRNEADRVFLDGADLAELIAMVEEGVVSSSAAKDVLDGVLSGRGRPREVAEDRDLIQVSDTKALESAVDEVIAANPRVVDDYRRGEEKVVGFLVGQVMKATGGKADPRLVNRLLRDRLST